MLLTTTADIPLSVNSLLTRRLLPARVLKLAYHESRRVVQDFSRLSGIKGNAARFRAANEVSVMSKWLFIPQPVAVHEDSGELSLGQRITDRAARRQRMSRICLPRAGYRTSCTATPVSWCRWKSAWRTIIPARPSCWRARKHDRDFIARGNLSGAAAARLSCAHPRRRHIAGRCGCRRGFSTPYRRSCN